jgi:hypothetical protein
MAPTAAMKATTEAAKLNQAIRRLAAIASSDARAAFRRPLSQCFSPHRIEMQIAASSSR